MSTRTRLWAGLALLIALLVALAIILLGGDDEETETANLSILFTTDAQLFVSDDYTILEDDKGVLPAGNVLFVASEQAASEAGPDFGATIETVQEGLTTEVIQELNARVDIDKEKPEDVAAAYLEETGYVGGGADAIEENPENGDVALTIGSKNFTEQFILGEIYAQGLEAAGYEISTDLNLGSEQVALKALEAGEISGYPEYTSTALTSFFDFAPEDVPADAQQAFEETEDDFAKQGLVAYPPTPFTSANAVGLLTSTAEDLGISQISDLSEYPDLTLYGSPECRQRIDCLAGLEEYYGLDGLRENFTPVDIGLRYDVLDEGAE